MQKSLRNFFVLSLMLALFYNVSGLSLSIDHAQHSKNASSKIKKSKSEKETCISQDDDCQCALHMQMNHVVIPESLSIDSYVSVLINSEVPHSKATAYRCLLDYFSSRAPPSNSAAAA